MENKGEQSYKRLTKLQDFTAESGADYILPDYLGDVRKILFTECIMGPTGKGRTDGGEEYYGTVCYNIMYLDSDGKPTGTSFTSDYEIAVRHGDEAATVFGIPRIVTSAVRLVGPRKFTAKATVSVSPKLLVEEDISVSGDVFGGVNEPEYTGRVMKFAEISESETVERDYAEALERLDGKISDEIEILYSGADIELDGAEQDAEGVLIRGNLIMYAVVSDSESPVYLVEKIIPIEEHITVSWTTDEVKLAPRGAVVSLTTNVNADESGCVINCSAVVEYCVGGEFNSAVEVIKDAYLKERETVNGYREIKCTELCDRISISESLSATMPGETVCQDVLREVTLLTARPRIEEVSSSGSELNVVGETKFSGFGSVTLESGEISYAPIKFISPFNIKVKCPAPIPENATTELMLDGGLASAIIDEDSVDISYRLNGAVRILCTGTVRALSDCVVAEGEEYVRPSGRITVYYPEKGDTLFSVAKKYHTSATKVAWDNSVSTAVSSGTESGELDGVKSLIIY